jgi:hypothetical protein
MSIERELLKRWLFDFGKIHPDVGLIKATKELLAQPEQEPTTRHALDSYWNQEAYQRGYAEAKLKLKREPLGLEIMDVCGSEDYREGFKDGALYAEKCHGIGDGE